MFFHNVKKFSKGFKFFESRFLFKHREMKNNEEIIDGWSRFEAEPTSALRAGDVPRLRLLRLLPLVLRRHELLGWSC